MSIQLPQIYLARHGQTAWSLSGQHTGRTDIPLTPAGEDQARRMGARLAGREFRRVLTSPSQRARRTCELSGFGLVAQVDPDLAEWDYGDFEGLLSTDIDRQHPGWRVFHDGGPHGESVADIGIRARRMVEKLRAVQADVLVFSSSHFLRTLAATWLGLEPAAGQYFTLDTGSLGILGYEHTLEEPVIQKWNEVPQNG